RARRALPGRGRESVEGNAFVDETRARLERRALDGIGGVVMGKARESRPAIETAHRHQARRVVRSREDPELTPGAHPSGAGRAGARIPGTNTFLLPTRRSPGLAEAADLLVIDTEGKLLAGEGEPNSEFWIHARLYAARPDVGGVVHAHPPACVCLTQIGQPHRVVHNQGGAFYAGVPEYERIGLIRTRELGDLLARKLGSGLAVMMR